MSANAARTAPLYPGIDSTERTAGPSFARASGFVAANSLLIVCVSVFAIALTFGLAIQVNPDAWLAFLNGRWIVHHGLPHSDVFTLWGKGPWADQQWLAQLALYGLFAAGGVALAAFAHAVLTLAALVGTIAAARWLDASSRSVLFLFPLAVVPLITSQWQVRTQSFAYPLFAAVLFLLIQDARRPTRRVLLVLPLLALWANVHGSVALAAGLVCLRGLTRVVSSVGRYRLVGIALAALAPLMVFVSPYALSLGGYYRHTLFNPAFGAMLNEWQPPHFAVVTAPFYALALAVMWLLGRSRCLTPFDKLALLATLAAALSATRNLGWFAVTALMLAPAALDDAYPERSRRRLPSVGIGVVLPSLCAGVAVLMLVLTLARPSAWFMRSYPTAAGNAVARAARAHPRQNVFADVKYADWLVFEHSELAGRIAYDARFELLSTRRISQIYYLDTPYGASWRNALRGFRIVMLDRRVEERVLTGLRAAGARVLYDGHGAAVLASPL